jgi:hypothetical protein
MRDDYEEPYLKTACQSWKADCFTPAVVSEYLGKWDEFVAPVLFQGEFDGLSAETAGDGSLKVVARRRGGGETTVLFEEGRITVAGDRLEKFRGGKYRFFGCEFEVPVVRRGDGVEIDMSR